MDIADKVLLSLSQPYFLEEHTLSITPSIGVSLYPQHGESTESLMSRADTAMYEVKKQGRRGYQIYQQTSQPD
jgi:diguanylate cyclase (GGDEF)-like protein